MTTDQSRERHRAGLDDVDRCRCCEEHYYGEWAASESRVRVRHAVRRQASRRSDDVTIELREGGDPVSLVDIDAAVLDALVGSDIVDVQYRSAAGVAAARQAQGRRRSRR